MERVREAEAQSRAGAMDTGLHPIQAALAATGGDAVWTSRLDSCWPVLKPLEPPLELARC